jgi:hypothetical protein
MLFVLRNAETRNREYVNDLSSAGLPIGGAIAAARAIACGFIGMIARMSGVTVWALHAAILDTLVTAIPNDRVVIAAPEIRQATLALRGVTVRAWRTAILDAHVTAIQNDRIVIATPQIR